MSRNSLQPIAIILMLLFCVQNSVFGQSPLGEEGNQLNLSTGYTNKGFPIYFSYEMGVFEDISFGLEISSRFYNESGDTTDYNHTISNFSFVGNYYFNKLLKIEADKWFVYGGIRLSYYKYFSPKGYWAPGSSSGTLGASAHLGGRYYFSDWGILLELGAGTDNVRGLLGVSYRFDY